METLVYLVTFVVLLAVGYFAGTAIEMKHYQSIEARERQFLHLPTVSTQRAVDEHVQIADVKLVAGSATISVDYFKRALAGLRNLFGGRMSSYETLIDRARREAILRMKDAAKGTDTILNLRIETSRIGQRSGRDRSVGSIEAIAYGTAVTFKH